MFLFVYYECFRIMRQGIKLGNIVRLVFVKLSKENELMLGDWDFWEY